MKNIHKTLASLAALSATMGLLKPAMAQDATLVISGQVTSSTCALKITIGSIASNSSSASPATRTINMGTQTSTATAANTLIGAKTVAQFDLRNAADTGPCTSGSTWNLMLNLTSAQITPAGSDTAVVNSLLASGGTNAGAALFGGTNTTASSRLNLVAFTDLTNATKVNSTNVLMNAPLYIGAQFVTTSAAAPTVGAYSAAIPLYILYN